MGFLPESTVQATGLTEKWDEVKGDTKAMWDTTVTCTCCNWSLHLCQPVPSCQNGSELVYMSFTVCKLGISEYWSCRWPKALVLEPAMGMLM